MKDEAIKLAKKGFKIIPCNNKIPIIPKWQFNATNDINKIKNMWKESNYNIGILTGCNNNNLVIIDCDIKKNYNGIANFNKFLLNNNIVLPTTLTATSGNGGKHYYFKSKSANIKSGVNIFDVGIDIRANGGLIIAPPSIHPNGNKYVWDNNLSIAELPKELEELIINSQKEKVKIKVKKNSNKKEYTEVKDIQIGERNETLFRLSSKLIETGLCYDSILNAINIENKLKCIEPLSENEIVNIVNSSYKFKDNKRIANNSINKIFSGKNNIKTKAISWNIRILS